MSKYGERVGKDAIRFTRDLPGPIERVWAYITDPEKRSLWLAGGETSAEIGGEAVFEFDHSKLTPHEEEIPERYRTETGEVEFDLRFVGEVLAYDPPHQLKVTWPDSNDTDSTLTITLTEKDDRVEFILLHERLPNDEFARDVLSGWHAHLRIMEDRLNGREPEPFWPEHMQLLKEYETR